MNRSRCGPCPEKGNAREVELKRQQWRVSGGSNPTLYAKQSCCMRILKEVQRNGPDCAALRDLKESGELAVEVS